MRLESLLMQRAWKRDSERAGLFLATELSVLPAVVCKQIAKYLLCGFWSAALEERVITAPARQQGRFRSRATCWEPVGKVSLGTRALLRVLGQVRHNFRAVPELNRE